MSIVLSGLVGNLLHKNECKDCEFCFQYETIQVIKVLQFNCVACNKSYKKEPDEKLKQQLVNTHKFCKGDINQFDLMFQKGVYTYNTLIIVENLMKHHQLKKRVLQQPKYGKYY